jgi:hypothetical protein
MRETSFIRDDRHESVLSLTCGIAQYVLAGGTGIEHRGITTFHFGFGMYILSSFFCFIHVCKGYSPPTGRETSAESAFRMMAVDLLHKGCDDACYMEGTL